MSGDCPDRLELYVEPGQSVVERVGARRLDDRVGAGADLQQRVLCRRRRLQSKTDARFADEELARLAGGRRGQRKMVRDRKGSRR